MGRCEPSPYFRLNRRDDVPRPDLTSETGSDATACGRGLRCVHDVEEDRLIDDRIDFPYAALMEEPP